MAYQVLCKKEPWTKTATDSANSNNKSSGKSSSLNAHQVMSHVLKGKRPEDLSPVPLNCPAALLELMRDCVAHEYFMRPSSSEVVATLCAFLEAEAERTAAPRAATVDARTSAESDMQTLMLKMAEQLKNEMKAVGARERGRGHLSCCSPLSLLYCPSAVARLRERATEERVSSNGSRVAVFFFFVRTQ